jgi:hypothetical protein
LRGLRRAYPGHRVVLAGPAGLEPLARLTGAVDGVLDTEPLGRVPGWPPELAVNLHDAGGPSTEPLRVVGAGQIWAYGEPDAPIWDPAEHEVARWCRLLAEHDVPCDPDALDLRTPDDEPPAAGLTVIHPGADPDRRWPASRWAAVAEQLHAAGHQVVVTGGTEDQDLARAVVVGSGLPERANLAGRLSLDELAALVAYARLVLCADGGLAHLATAYRTPSVVLFSSRSPDQWGPPPDRPQHRVLTAGSGDPRDIGVAEILDAVAAPAR